MSSSGEEKKPPYFSSRVTVRDVTAPARYIGHKSITIEVVYGNREAVIIMNKGDVSEKIGNITIAQKTIDLHDEATRLWKEKGYRFIEDVAET